MEAQANESRRRASLVTLYACNTISLGLVLWVGRQNRSTLLIVMFAVWVESPFVGLMRLYNAAKDREVARQRATYLLMFLVSLATVLIYAVMVLLVHQAKPAAPFLFVPALSWVVIAIALRRAYFNSESSRA